jgi:hypothetical protein
VQQQYAKKGVQGDHHDGCQRDGQSYQTRLD